MSKEEFKSFVKKHKTLAKQVNNGSMTWQKFYDMYRLYGEESDVWKEYLEEKEDSLSIIKEDATLKDFITMMKNIDLEKVRKGIDGMQKAVSFLQTIGGANKQEEYEPRPIYRHFED